VAAVSDFPYLREVIIAGVDMKPVIWDPSPLTALHNLTRLSFHPMLDLSPEPDPGASKDDEEPIWDVDDDEVRNLLRRSSAWTALIL
jgi:hypothetical protein